VALAHFQREALLGREIDVLNLRWMGRTFWRKFRGGAKSLPSWYRSEVFKTLGKQKISILIMILFGAIAVAISYGWFASHSTQLAGTATPEEISAAFGSGLNLPGQTISISLIFWHNVRAIAIIALLGLFSFGVLGVLFYLTNMGIIGGVLGLLKAFGFSPFLLAVYGILPHGIFELPALILSSAAILHIGVSLVTPAAHKTLGETILENLADWVKINLGIVIPLLAIAAVVETWITPFLLISFMK
jgi:stage II sporulation protein M